MNFKIYILKKNKKFANTSSKYLYTYFTTDDKLKLLLLANKRQLTIII